MMCRRVRCIVGVCLIVVFFLGVSGCAYIGERVAKKSLRTFFSMTYDDLLRHILLIDCDMLAREGIGGASIITMLVNGFITDNRELNSVNALLYAAYGVIVEHEDTEYAMYLLRKGVEYGITALKTNKKFREGLEEGEKIHKLVQHLDEKYKSPLLFTAFAWFFVIYTDPDDMFEVVNLPDIISMLDRSLELDDEYLYGLGMAMRGGYYAFLPEMMGLGGGPENAKVAFDKSKSISDGKVVIADVLRARMLCTLMKDEEMFDTILKNAIALPHNHFPEGQLLNELARWLAGQWIRDKDEWF